LTGNCPFPGDSLEQQLAAHLATPAATIGNPSRFAHGVRRRHRQGQLQPTDLAARALLAIARRGG